MVNLCRLPHTRRDPASQRSGPPHVGPVPGTSPDSHTSCWARSANGSHTETRGLARDRRYREIKLSSAILIGAQSCIRNSFCLGIRDEIYSFVAVICNFALLKEIMNYDIIFTINTCVINRLNSIRHKKAHTPLLWPSYLVRLTICQSLTDL